MQNKTINDLISRYAKLSVCEDDIVEVFHSLLKCFEQGNRLYVFGNGGSAADSLHIVGELVKSFMIKRPVENNFSNCVSKELSANLHGALPAFAIVENIALATAFSNDCNHEYTFAQQIYAYARKDDCVLGISTSGNSKNIINAIETAKGRGAVTIGLTGENGGKLKELCDVCICVPETETYKIQELHLPVYHCLCMMLEEHFFK
jgi:D-sedoheptulose 7-phosphate isomerase